MKDKIWIKIYSWISNKNIHRNKEDEDYFQQYPPHRFETPFFERLFTKNHKNLLHDVDGMNVEEEKKSKSQDRRCNRHSKKMLGVSMNMSEITGDIMNDEGKKNCKEDKGIHIYGMGFVHKWRPLKKVCSLLPSGVGWSLNPWLYPWKSGKASNWVVYTLLYTLW